MTEFFTLGFFIVGLFFSLIFGVPLVAALLFGLGVFFAYGLYKKHSFRQLLLMALNGIKTVKNILITFILIGTLTALWRAGGTIPFIVYHSIPFCHPKIIVLATFLLCCMISVLTGTAFGTAATIGVICVTIANSMGVPILYSGGAVLAGSYFGDRCSPMSTSALLVSTITKTDLYRNIGGMIKTAIAPFILSCLLYGLFGMGFEGGYDNEPMRVLFRESFSLAPVVLIPAAAIVVLSLCRLNVKIAMSISVLCSIVICLTVQKLSIGDICSIALLGYHPEGAQLGQLLSGGGIFSMAKVFSIVCISSCYSGIFNGTGLLDGLRGILVNISKKASPFVAYLITAILTAMVACNQALATMLTGQLCQDIGEPPEKAALHMENTVIVIAPLIPWSIAGAVALESVGAPTSGILTSFFLYLLPLWMLLVETIKSKKKSETGV